MKHLAVVITILMLVSGCEKPENFMFDCRVYNQRNQLAVANANVVMKAQRVDGGFNPTFETIGSATTDANGGFYIEVDKEVFYSIAVEVTHPNHFSGTFSIDPDDVPFSSAYEQTFVVEPRAWVATRLVNQNFSNSVTFSVESDNPGCTECCDDNNTILQGFGIDTVFVCPVYGEQEVTIAGNYADGNGGTIQINESAFLQAFDTTTITVIY